MRGINFRGINFPEDLIFPVREIPELLLSKASTQYQYRFAILSRFHGQMFKIFADQNLWRLFFYRPKLSNPLFSFVLTSDKNFCRLFLYRLTFLPSIINNADFFYRQGTLSDKISADKTAENLTCYRKFCPPKSFVRRKFCPPKYFVHWNLKHVKWIQINYVHHILSDV